MNILPHLGGELEHNKHLLPVSLSTVQRLLGAIWLVRWTQVTTVINTDVEHKMALSNETLTNLLRSSEKKYDQYIQDLHLEANTMRLKPFLLLIFWEKHLDKFDTLNILIYIEYFDYKFTSL